MTYYTYILRCADGSLYTGITTDPARRFAEHAGQSGRGAKYTALRRPLRFEAVWASEGRGAASRLEARIKALPRARKERLLSGGLPEGADPAVYTRLPLPGGEGSPDPIFMQTEEKSMAISLESTRKLGFGLMRLPKTGDRIDVEQVKVMADRFLAAGFTYFDTAWVYAGSEDAIRQALVERHPRESYTLATKNAAWSGCKTREDAVAQFEGSLRRTGAGYFDYYLLHNLGEARTRVFDDFGLWDFVREKKEQGLIRHIGFSFHATAEELDAILTAHPEAEFVQLQINYADWESPTIQSRACYETARRHGKPVVVMEPVKGGLLAAPPKPVADVLRAADPQASPASWAIRFAASLDGVLTVLSGMSDTAQMEDNLSTMQAFRPLDEAGRETVRRAQAALAAIPLIPCTACDYCAKVCPNQIGISGTFSAMNMLTLYGKKDAAREQLEWMTDGHGKKRPDQCVRCGACEEICPQHIAIRDELEKAAGALR